MPPPTPAALHARLLTIPGNSFPRTIEKIQRLMALEASATVIRAVITSDPMLTAMVIGQANGSGGLPITRLSIAADSLGQGALHGTLLQAEPVPPHLRSTIGALWQTANATATMVRLIAAQCAAVLPTYDPETLHHCGLLHDLGTAVAVLHFSTEHDQAAKRCASGDGPFQVALKQELGLHAGEMGSLVARAWNIPDPIASVIRHHLNPSRATNHPELNAVVHLARAMVRGLGYSGGVDRWVDPIDEKIFVMLRLRLADFDALANRFLTEITASELYEEVIS